MVIFGSNSVLAILTPYSSMSISYAVLMTI